MTSLPHESLGIELFRLWRGSWRRSEIAFTGGSMAPLTEGGQALVLSHGSQAPCIGDIVLARQRGNLVSHRIIARYVTPDGSPAWITQGDASPAPDPAPLSAEDVLGIVVGVVTPQGTREIGGPCWGWARRYAAAQTRWVSRVTGTAAPFPKARRWAMRLHRRALHGAFGAAEALEELRGILEDWQVHAFRPPLARLISQSLGGPPPGADLVLEGLRQAEALGMDLLLLRWMAQRGLPCRSLEPVLARRKAALAFRQMQWRPKLEAVIQALRRIGIEPMALKGFAQSLTLFHGDALREMRDIDLLVPPEREAEARAALEALGFVTLDRQEPDARHHHGAPQVDPASRLFIELHREVVPEKIQTCSLTAGFRSRAETAAFGSGGVKVQVPCREDRLLHLCLHLKLHRYLGCLRDALEIALLIEDDAPPWDWGKMERVAREGDALPALHLGLGLSVLVFRARVPPEFMGHLRAACPRRSFARTRLRLLARQLTGPVPERREGWVKAARWLCKAAAPI